MRLRRPYRRGRATACMKSQSISLLLMQRLAVDSGNPTCFAQSPDGDLSNTDILDQDLAVFQNDHSSMRQL
jgi:hypothetical protein